MSIFLLMMYLFIPNTFVNACAVSLTTTAVFETVDLKPLIARSYGEASAPSSQRIRTDDRKQIFDKFFRSADNQRIPASDLGLHLARELARRHGGNVTLAPQADTLGALFTLTLPSAQAMVRKA